MLHVRRSQCNAWCRDAAAAKSKPHQKLRAAIEKAEGSSSAARPAQYKRPALRQNHSLYVSFPPYLSAVCQTLHIQCQPGTCGTIPAQSDCQTPLLDLQWRLWRERVQSAGR